MVVPARIPYEKTLTKLTVLQSIVGILCLQKEWVQKALENLSFFAQKAYLKVTRGQCGYLSIQEFYLYTICANKAPGDEGKGFLAKLEVA